MPVKGFLLNDVPTLLKGANIHHDNGPLGAAAYDRADERKIELLKASGFNAVRLSHNPPAPELLDACDRLGMLVIDEFFDYWDRPKKDKSHYDVFAATWEQDLENTILRDRNHPSIILWSIGNEIRDQFNDHGAIWAKRLADKTRALDPSREVTASLCRIVGEDIDWPTREPFMSALDVVGYNYMLEFYEESHRREPNRVIMSAESRGREAFDYWMAVEDHAYIVGDFVWTGMDYLGEVSVGWLGFGKRDYPWIAAYCGDLDLCGFKRPYAYYRNVLWGDTGVYPVVHNPDPSAKFGTPYQKKWGYPDADMSWTWPGHEGEKLKVDVFSRCERVRLLVNGTDYGVVYPNRESKFIAGWNEVVYEPGILQVIGYEGPNEVARWSLRTAGAAARIRMTADRTVIHADKQDMVYVTLEVVDGQGLRLPQAEIPIQLKVEGGGALIGFGNGNPTSVESFQQSVRTTFEGRCMAIIKAGDTPGPIWVTATAPNLKSDKLEIQTR
jgi:beta-galactosidase